MELTTCVAVVIAPFPFHETGRNHLSIRATPTTSSLDIHDIGTNSIERACARWIPPKIFIFTFSLTSLSTFVFNHDNPHSLLDLFSCMVIYFFCPQIMYLFNYIATLSFPSCTLLNATIVSDPPSFAILPRPRLDLLLGR